MVDGSTSRARRTKGVPFAFTYPWQRRKAMTQTSEAGDQSQALSDGQAGTVDRLAAMLEQQRQTIAELQTPVIQVWDGILALPIVGSLDTARTQEMNEALLQKVVDTGAEIVIVDITAVPVVDTAVAKHLLETVSAARLLGAEVMIVGLSSKTALTLV